MGSEGEKRGRGEGEGREARREGGGEREDERKKKAREKQGCGVWVKITLLITLLDISRHPWKLNDLRIPTVTKCVYLCFTQLFPNTSDYRNLFLAFIPLQETLGEALIRKDESLGTHINTTVWP